MSINLECARLLEVEISRIAGPRGSSIRNTRRSDWDVELIVWNHYTVAQKRMPLTESSKNWIK